VAFKATVDILRLLLGKGFVAENEQSNDTQHYPKYYTFPHISPPHFGNFTTRNAERFAIKMPELKI
jgi:hypothetical protein